MGFRLGLSDVGVSQLFIMLTLSLETRNVMPLMFSPALQPLNGKPRNPQILKPSKVLKPKLKH